MRALAEAVRPGLRRTTPPMWQAHRGRNRRPAYEKGRVLRARTALQALKQRTADTHREVEDVLALLDPDLDARRLGAVIARFHAFWRVTETAVDSWALGSAVSGTAATGPDPAAHELAARLEWPRRRRAALFAADQRALGAASPSAEPIAPFTRVTTPDALGWLYVSEGATLGGAVLARHLAPRGLAVASFSPYAEGPGPMWLRFGEVLQDWTAEDPDRVEAVAAAARTCFDALAAWVDPLRRDEAA